MELLINLTVLAFIAAFSPVLISVCILLLSTGRPLGNAIAYIVGLVLSLMVVGGLALVLLDDPPTLEGLGLRHGISPGLSLALGGVCVAVAAGAYLRAPDPHAPPPKWLTSIEAITPGRAFVIGLLLLASNIKIWLVYAIGLAQILASGLGRTVNLVILLAFVLAIQLGVLTPLGVYLWKPQNAQSTLTTIRRRLEQAYRWVAIVIFAVIGGYLMVNGLMKG